MFLRAGTQRDISFLEYAANAAMMSATEWHEECGAQSVERRAAANAAMMSATEWHEECGRFHKMYLMNPDKEWRNEG